MASEGIFFLSMKFIRKSASAFKCHEKDTHIKIMWGCAQEVLCCVLASPSRIVWFTRNKFLHSL